MAVRATTRKKAGSKPAQETVKPAADCATAVPAEQARPARAVAAMTDVLKRRIVTELIWHLRDRILGSGDALRATVGDLIRLLQLEKEIAPDRARKLTVKWVDEKEGDE